MKTRILQSAIAAILSFSLIISINAAFAENENNTDSNFTNFPEINDASVPRGGFIQVLFATDPAYPDTTNQTNLEFDFVNKEINSIQQDVDYKISINQGSNEVYVMPITHSSQGSVSFPFQFKNPGEYQIVVGIYGMSFEKIPVEYATFTVTVLSSSTSPQATSLGTSQNSISGNQSSQGIIAQKFSSGQEISTPEFGSMVGIISICAIIGMIVISRKFN